MKINFMKLSILPILTLSFLLLSACKKDIRHGENSIKGIWKVVKIESLYADFTVNGDDVSGFGESEKVLDEGSLGHFNFSDSKVAYNFTRNDTLYSGKGSWELQLDKVNEGFTKVNKWKLIIDNDYQLDVYFEDGTKNAEKKATNVQFDSWPSESGSGVAYFIKLEKQ